MAMVTRPKRGSIYRDWRGYIDGVFIIGGKRRFRALGPAKGFVYTPAGKKRTEGQLKQAVEAAWEAKRTELETGEEGKNQGDGRPIDKVMAEWIEKAPDNGISTATIEMHYDLMRRQYLEGVGNHPLRDISIQQIDAFKGFLRKKGLGPVTVNIRLDKLKTFLRWAERRRYVTALPTIEKLKEPKTRPKVPQPHQVRAFIGELMMLAAHAPDPRHRYFYELHFMELLFVLGTGVRRAGPLFTPWSDAYLDQGAMLMRKYKGGETLVFLPKILVGYLKNRRERFGKHKWLFDNGDGELAYEDAHSMTTSFRRHKARLGYGALEFKPLHGFRSNFATVNLNELGLDSATVSNLLNHSSFKTTEDAYVADMAKEKRRAIDAYEDQYLTGLIDRNLIENGFFGS